jgi:hypothetical protein
MVIRRLSQLQKQLLKVSNPMSTACAAFCQQERARGYPADKIRLIPHRGNGCRGQVSTATALALPGTRQAKT